MKYIVKSINFILGVLALVFAFGIIVFDIAKEQSWKIKKYLN